MIRAVRVFRYVWASPYSLVGLLLLLVALPLGATIRICDGALEVAGGRFGVWVSRLPLALRFSAITFGHVIVGVNHASLASVSAHEHVHVRQYERWGVLFIPLYCGASLLQLFRGRNPHLENCFEREAYATASVAAVRHKTC